MRYTFVAIKYEKKLGQLFCDRSANDIVAMLEEGSEPANAADDRALPEPGTLEATIASMWAELLRGNGVDVGPIHLSDDVFCLGASSLDAILMAERIEGDPHCRRRTLFAHDDCRPGCLDPRRDDGMRGRANTRSHSPNHQEPCHQDGPPGWPGTGHRDQSAGDRRWRAVYRHCRGERPRRLRHPGLHDAACRKASDG